MGAKFTGESCKCTPGRECTPRGRAREFNFKEIGEIWTAGEVIQVVLASSESVLWATTKKVVNCFGEEKCTPAPDKILATPMMGGASKLKVR